MAVRDEDGAAKLSGKLGRTAAGRFPWTWLDGKACTNIGCLDMTKRRYVDDRDDLNDIYNDACTMDGSLLAQRHAPFLVHRVKARF